MSNELPAYCVVKVINGVYAGKYGIILQRAPNESYIVEIDNKEVSLDYNDFDSQEYANLIAFDIFSIGFDEPKKWIIIDPAQKYGVGKEKEFCGCSTSSCFNFPSFESAQEFLSEHYEILQVGLIT